MKKRLLPFVKLFVAISLLVFLFSQLDYPATIQALRQANLLLIIIAGSLAFPGILISVLRWKQCLQNFDFYVSTLKLYSIYSISTFFNNFLPSSIGGDVYKVIILDKQFPHKKKLLLSSIVQDRGVGLVSLFIVNLSLIPFFYPLLQESSAFLFLEITIFALFIFLVIVFSLQKYLEEFLTKIHIHKISFFHKILSIFVALTKFRSSRSFLISISLSVLFTYAIGLAKYLVLIAFDVEVSFWYVTLVTTITQIAGLFPISLNSIGITEGLSVFLYGIIGIPIEISLPIALIGRVSLMVTSSIGGLFYFVKDRIPY